MSVNAERQCLLLPQLVTTAADWIISHSPLIFIVSVVVSCLGLLTVFKPKPWFSARTEENRNRNFSWA